MKIAIGLVLVLWGSMLCSVTLAAEQQCHSDTFESTTPLSRFNISELTVTDHQTGLTWQKCFAGLSGGECSKGEPLMLNWAAAHQYAEDLNKAGGFSGFSDWRIPNIRELQSVAELGCVEPALNPLLFPSAPSGRTWSSSPYKFYPHYSWFVDFKFFEVTYQERYKPYFVLLVRAD